MDSRGKDDPDRCAGAAILCSKLINRQIKKTDTRRCICSFMLIWVGYSSFSRISFNWGCKMASFFLDRL